MVGSLDTKSSEINSWQKNIRAIFIDRPNAQNQIESIGTGFSIKYADKVFFITAKHVIDGFVGNQSNVYVSNAACSLSITIDKSCFQYASQRLINGSEVEVDFVFADVTDNPDFENAGLATMFDENEQQNKINCVKFVGYPATKNKFVKRQASEPEIMKMYEYNGKNIQQDTTLPEIHFLFDLPIKGKQKIPSPDGCSGGPVFVYSNYFQAFAIDGLFIKYKKKTGKATAVRFEYILNTIEQYIKT